MYLCLSLAGAVPLWVLQWFKHLHYFIMWELFFKQLHLRPISTHKGRPTLGNLCWEGIAFLDKKDDMQEASLWFYSHPLSASQINTLSAHLHGHLVYSDGWTGPLCVYCAFSVHIRNEWGVANVQNGGSLEYFGVFLVQECLWKDVTFCICLFFFFSFYFVIYSWWYSLPDV